MTLYHDNGAGGAWAYCPKCKFAGDMIELAALYWDGLSIPITAKKLASLGMEIPEERLLPICVKDYMDMHTDRRARFWNLWAQSQKRLLVDDSKVIRGLQHKLGIRLGLDHDRWLKGPGLFIGGNSKQAVESCFQPLAAERAKLKGALENCGGNRVFLGPGWIDVLVVPLMDLPGRIKGFIFIGREADLKKDMLCSIIRHNNFFMVDRRTRAKRGLDNDCGIALYEATQFATDSLIVMSDPILAIRLQCWYLQDHGTPAPLVSIYSSNLVRTNPQIWDQITHRPVFWGKPDGELFRHAKAANAKVCLSGFTPNGPMPSFTRTPLAEWLQRIAVEAKPWNEVLEKLLDELPAVQAESILIGMELTPGELSEFLSSCPDALRKRIEPCSLRTQARTVVVNGAVIREDHGWYNNQSGEQICNGILRIEQVIYHEKMNQSYYAGRILFRDVEVSFCDSVEEIETSTFQWMRTKLLKSSVGFFEFSPRWQPLVVAIATKFHPPVVCKGFNSIGWDIERSCFVFPSFIITSKGEIVKEPSIKVHKRRTPALMLDQPAAMTSEDLESLPKGDGAAVFWATAACIASNILAPVFGVNTSSIGLCGSCAESTGKVAASMLGCAEHSVQLGKKAESLEDICVEHGWPIFLKPPKKKLEDWSEWLAKITGMNCIVPLNWYAAKALTTRPGWHIIEAGNYIASIEICETARKVLPSFLQYVAQRQFKLPAGYKRTDDTSFARIVLVWLSQWLAEMGGNHRVVLGALKVLNFDGDAGRRKHISTSFTDLLCCLFDNGEIAIERAGFIPAKKKVKALICFPGEQGSIGGVFVPKATINKILIAHNAPPLDTSVLTDALVETGAAAEHIYAGVPGWMLKEDLWNKRLDAWVSWHKYKLRVEE